MRLSLILSIIVTFISCTEVKRDCNAYKTGQFKVNKVDSLISETYITRTQDYQIEEFEQYYKRDFNGKLIKHTEKHKDTFHIHWVNDCEFVLKKLHPKSKLERKAFFIKILTTKVDSYYFEGRFEDNKGLIYQTAYRIK
jgi:hypothetical protein